MDLYRPLPEPREGGWKAADKRWKANWRRLKQVDQKAKAKGKMIGRYIKHPYADGYAVYQIVNVTGTQAEIEVITGIGDDWVLPAWGEKARISLSKARAFLEHRDALALFIKAS